MDMNRIKELTEWFRTHDGRVLCEMDVDKYFVKPLMDAFGDDVNQILAYLNKMDVDALDEIEGCFEYIYKKFTTDEVYETLGKLEEKIDRESTRMKEARENQ